MGIRFENKTKLDWIRQMEEFLRLVIESKEEQKEPMKMNEMEQAYQQFFNRERSFFQRHQLSEIERLLHELDPEQIPLLANLLIQDGLMHQDSSLLANARHVIESNMRSTGAMTLADYEHLSLISNALKS